MRGLSLVSKAKVTSAFKRCFSASKGQTGLIELRTYDTIPSKTLEYKELAKTSASVRSKYTKDSWKLFLSAETGYGSLSEFVHLYTYDSMVHRAEVRKAMGKDEEWKKFLEESKPCLSQQQSEIFVPTKIAGIDYFASEASLGESDDTVYEIRHYQLLPGYTTVPKMIDIFARGLPDKLAACDSSLGELIVLAHSDVSTLNQFIEIWRYPSPAASIEHREASRKALVWRETIAEAAKITVTFKNRIMIPTSFSPLK